MKPTAPIEWHRLISGAFDDTLTPAQQRELAELLSTRPEARNLWYIYSDNECSLAEIRRSMPAALTSIHRSDATSTVPAAWLRSRTIQAAVAGLIVGLLCASVGWAVSSPGLLAIKSRALPLVNAGFETGTAPATEGVPREFGVWGGDFSTLSSGEHGVTPSEGKQMLRFLKSYNQNTPPGVETRAAEVWQAIDMTPFLKPRQKDPIVVELSAQFNAEELPGSERVVFGVSLEAFSGEVQQLPSLWEHRRELALVRSGREQPAGYKTGKWQTVSTQLSIPEDANILALHLFAVRKGKGQLSSAFPSLFLDGVSLRLLEADPQSNLSKR